MEYSLGNKKQQTDYNIEEKITSSQIIIRYNPYTQENKNPLKIISKETSSKPPNTTEREKNFKKYYLFLKCDKAYSGITHFYSSNVNIMKFEKKFFGNFRSLIIVDLSYNSLSKIPAGLFKLKYIKELNLEYNHINYVQHQLSFLTNLEKLNLSNNELSFLPNSLFKLQKLQILLLNYNKIKFIPIEIGLMKNLQRLNLYNNLINELPTTLCNNINLKNIDFEWIYILKKSFYLSDYKEMPDDDEIYEMCLKFFLELFNKHILYCDKNTFFTYFSVPQSLYYENIISNLNSKNDKTEVSETEIKFQKRNFFNELIKYIKLKDVQKVYKYSNLLLNLPDFKDEDFLSKNKMTPFHYLFSSFKQIKISNINRQNKNISNITEKDSMIINENNKICSSRGNKINIPGDNKGYLSANKLEDNIIMAKSKIIGNYLFEILSNKIINIRSLDLWGPIHIAIRRSGYECLEWIINKNKKMKEIYSHNINNSNEIINTGNSLTIKKAQTFSQKKLFNLNLKGKEDWTPLHLSASLGLVDCVYLLLQNKAEVYTRNNNYKTPKQVTNISEINKLLTLYELYVLEEKYNNRKKDLIKNNKNKLLQKNVNNQKSSQYYPSKTNINFFKEIFTSNEYSLNEISEAMNNLTMSVINPINKNFINENILNKFFESTLNELNLSNSSNQNRKNLLIITGFNSIGISLNNIFLMKLYQNVLAIKRLQITLLIKKEMISYIKYISSLNNITKLNSIKFNNKNKNNIQKKKIINQVNDNKIKNIKFNNKVSTSNPPINNNKRKINIINLANKPKYKNSINFDESDSSNNNSLLGDSAGLNSRNKNLIEKRINIKNEQHYGNTILSSANESCNIQESDISKLSISGIDPRGAGRIKYI